MTETDFLDFARRAAQRATRTNGQIGHLICTQARNPDEPTLREPEIRTAFQQEAEDRNLFYGIEVPTHYPYQFTGIGKRRALIDFVLLESASATASRNVLVEFKQGQPNVVQLDEDGLPDYPKITKDLHKLWAEPVQDGRCMFHICQAANSGTIKSLIGRYDAVTRTAMKRALETQSENQETAPDDTSDRWFLLLVLVLHQRGQQKGSYLHHFTWLDDHWQCNDSVPNPLPL